MHKIFCFNNGGSRDWLHAVAIADDGHVLGQHICSHESFMPHDLGLTSDWKHENYNAHFGVGNWQLEWVPTQDRSTHEGLKAAFEANKALSDEDVAKDDDATAAKVVVEFSDGTVIERGP
jgi:hypothetical protein